MQTDCSCRHPDVEGAARDRVTVPPKLLRYKPCQAHAKKQPPEGGRRLFTLRSQSILTRMPISRPTCARARPAIHLMMSIFQLKQIGPGRQTLIESAGNPSSIQFILNVMLERFSLSSSCLMRAPYKCEEPYFAISTAILL